MADKLKKSDFEKKLPEVTRRIREVNEQKEKAKEYNGLAAQRTKDACEANNINKWAFTAASQLLKKEPTEQIDRALTVFALALETGALAQMDLFDDRLTFIRAKLEKLAEGSPAPAPGASMVSQLSAVN